MKKIFLFITITLWYTFGIAQSDTCAGATVLSLANEGQLTIASSGSTTGMATTAGIGNTSPDVFYSLTPGAFQTVNVWLCLGNNFDAAIRIYDNNCGAPVLIAENDDGGGICGTSPHVTFQSDDTSTYLIMIEASDNPAGADNGTFDLSFWFEPPVPVPPAAEGVTCNSSTSGPSVLFTESFEDANLQGWTGNIITTGTTNGVWEFGVNTGGSPPHSGNTGPSAPQDGLSYMSYEASGNTTAVASAVTPAIDLTGTVEDAELSFYMHSFGNGMGDLVVRVGNTNTAPLTTELWSWSGQYQDTQVAAWYQVGLDLTPYLGQIIYLEFEQTGAANLRGDMAIDLVEVHVCDPALTIEEDSAFEKFALYPNPTNGILNFKSERTLDHISIYNFLGQEVRVLTPNNRQTSIDVSDLKNGVYIVKVKIEDSIECYKIVKN